jgi:tetratricopeptide (TPR) repeat protein
MNRGLLIGALIFASGLGLGGPALARRAPVKASAHTETADMHGYLEELEKRGLVDKATGTPERLQRELRRADEELVSGRPLDAASRLYAVVEGPRFTDLSESDDFADAEYRLGIALVRGGSGKTARSYFERALRRGKSAPLYEAAMRAYIDDCLDEKIAPECSGTLDKLKAEDINEELTYLRGRAAFDLGQRDVAEGELAKVTAKSRFYSSAMYLRGVLKVQAGDFGAAQDAFCTIADVKDGDPIRFYIDGRYYQLRDLARLALGRVAHEEGRYEDAFYHYFLIPSDSKKLPDALFEAAWSSLQRKDYDLGARLVEEFLKTFPSSSRVAEARVLYGTLLVKTCRFAKAEQVFNAVLAEYEPMTYEIERLIDDPAGRRSLAKRLLDRARSLAQEERNDAVKAAREANRMTPAEEARQKAAKAQGGALPLAAITPRPVEDVIAELLDLDPRFYRIEQLAHGLELGASDGSHVSEVWHELASTVDKTPVASSASRMDAPALLELTVKLGQEVSAARAEAMALPKAQRAEAEKSVRDLEHRRGELQATLERLLDVQPDSNAEQARGLSGLINADAVRAQELAGRSARLRAHLDDASSTLVREALVALRGRIDDTLRSSRLGKIDSVVGQKRKLEREIEDLAQGRFPPELFGKLHLEGLIKDDEIYWPPERELWLDEYDNFK